MKKRYFVLGLFLLILSGGLAWSAWIYFITTPMAFNSRLKETTRIFDSEGVLLDEIHGEEHRIVVDSNQIDEDIKAAVIAIEDANFYKHKGVSVRGVGRALNKAVRDSIAAGEVSINEGASTIPMQLAKNLNGSVQDRTFSNKITETIQAIKLNRTYSKDEILTKYLNTIYWGNNTYGIQTATQTYFGKDANNVEVHEAALLAAMIQNPSRFNPYHEVKEVKDRNYNALKNRQKDVLWNMSFDYSDCTQTKLEDGSIDRASYQTCLEEWTLSQWKKPLLLSGRTSWKNPTGVTGYIVDLAVNEIIERDLFNINSKKELEDAGLGLKIYSTIDLNSQRIAGEVVEKRDNVIGNAQMAVMGINPTTGATIFSIGGRDYNNSPLNRAMKEGGLQGRQPGSSMKTYVYATAMNDFNWTPDSTINDAPFCPVKATRWNKAYCPKNYDNSFEGINTVKNYLAKSRNIPAVKLGLYVGNSNVIRNMRKLGITTKLDPVPSFPLGSNDLYLVEHIAGYASFANGGKSVKPYSVDYITNTSDELIYKATPVLNQVWNTTGVNRVNEVLRYAATNGTGVLSNTVPNVHSKTGTTDREADVWCMSYIPDTISMGTWIGNDDYHKKMYGASSYSWACPVNGDILKKLNDLSNL